MGVSTTEPYEMFNKSIERGQRLYHRAASKWLNIPDDMGDINVRQGFGWKELLIIAGMVGLAGYFAPNIINHMRTQPVNGSNSGGVEVVEPSVNISVESRIIPPEE